MAETDKKTKNYERANKLRKNGEFDKALGVYRKITDEFDDEANGYWGCVLCKYGILYGNEDDMTEPKMKRASEESVMDDADFELVMEYSDGDERAKYRKEAKELEKLRRRIVEAAEDIDPVDVYICYKETDEDSEATPESVFAKETSDALTSAGKKVFCSKGMDEAAVYAALSSAGVMLVFGTDYEYFNAPDVKNEWSAYVQFAKNDEDKTIICCYKDVDEFDIPKEFSKSVKIDFAEEDAVKKTVSEVEKAFESSTAKKSAVHEDEALTAGDIQSAALLKRGFMALEDGEFEKADEFFEKALNLNAECPQAYLGKSLCEEKVKNVDEFAKRLFEKIDEKKEENLVELPKPDLVELARIADRNKGLLDEFEDMEIYKLIQDLDTTVSYTDSRAYFEEQADIMSEETVRKLVNNRDYDRAVRYADAKTKESLIGIFNSVSQTLKDVIDTEKEKATKAVTAADKAKTEIIETIQKRLANVAAEMDSRRAVICALSPGMKKIMEVLENIEDGDTIEFGRYHSENDEKVPVKWKVLKRLDDKALLISEKGLDTVPYNEKRTSITWADSDLRRFMNGEMLKTIFTDEEQGMLLKVKNENQNNAEFDTYGGIPTEDILFALSIKEAEEYFEDEDARCVKSTEYAVKKGAYVYSKNGTSWWWLRSPGDSTNKAARVNTYGDIFEDGYFVNYECYVARPAVWVDLSWTKRGIMS